MRSRWRWRDVRVAWNWRWIASGVAILVVLAGFGYLHLREPAPFVASCRDTAWVDSEMVWRRISGKWSCGMLRRTGATDPGRR